MIENESMLPHKLVFCVANRLYDCELREGAFYHVWSFGRDYETEKSRGYVGRWRPKDLLQNLQNGAWQIVSIYEGSIDEEDIQIGSLEEIL